MNIIDKIESAQIEKIGKTIPAFASGDTVKVGYKITEGERTRIQNYEGVVIARKGGSTLSASFTVRKISFGEGVERVFPLYSTSIESITVLRRGRVRRSKLYYLRGLRGKSARIAEKTNYKNEISGSTKTKD
jgi:large subunit ribosomal protein L19